MCSATETRMGALGPSSSHDGIHVHTLPREVQARVRRRHPNRGHGLPDQQEREAGSHQPCGAGITDLRRAWAFNDAGRDTWSSVDEPAPPTGCPVRRSAHRRPSL